MQEEDEWIAERLVGVSESAIRSADEAVRIVARGLMARAPIAVRIGTGTFALRLFEAACIRVCPEQPQPS